MKQNFDDFTTRDATDERPANFGDCRIPCSLGENCKHASVDECDQCRQKLLEEEHKEKCGPDCAHFNNPTKGMPDTSRITQEGPAAFLLRTRGVQ